MSLNYKGQSLFVDSASIKSIADNFINSTEFLGDNEKINNYSIFLETLYKNTFDRIPDQVGYNYWMNKLESGFESPTNVLLSFSESFESKTLFIESTSTTYI